MFKTKKFRKRNNSRPGAGGGGNRRGSAKDNKRVALSKLVNKNVEMEAELPYAHVHTFRDFELHHQLKQQIADRGYSIPTEIQDKAIPHILGGHDLIGLANTGTGKTAAFLIPIIQQLMEKPVNQHALIITPTRELANQISDEFRLLTKGLRLFSVSLIGGTSVNKSMKDLRRTNHLVIGTPGRLIDMVERRCLPLGSFNTLVLDEFDRMLDMGFLNDVEYLNSKMTRKSQTLLFSATIDASQRPVVEKMTHEALEVKAGTGKPSPMAIEQDVVHIPKDRKKDEVLFEIIKGEQGKKVLLFCETKRLVNKVYKYLLNDSVRVDMIHGDKTQKAREVALGKFKKGQVNVLVATDVVARGIDVSDVSLVINYDVPRNYNDYIHRIGRTGRAGKAGKAITLVN